MRRRQQHRVARRHASRRRSPGRCRTRDRRRTPRRAPCDRERRRVAVLAVAVRRAGSRRAGRRGTEALDAARGVVLLLGTRCSCRSRTGAARSSAAASLPRSCWRRGAARRRGWPDRPCSRRCSAADRRSRCRTRSWWSSRRRPRPRAVAARAPGAIATRARAADDRRPRCRRRRGPGRRRRARRQPQPPPAPPPPVPPCAGRGCGAGSREPGPTTAGETDGETGGQQ